MPDFDGPIAPATPTPDPNVAQAETLRAALTASGGNRERAAKALGISRQTLSARLRKHPDLVIAFPAKVGRPPKTG